MKRSQFDIQGTLGRGTFGMVFTIKGTASSEEGVFALKASRAEYVRGGGGGERGKVELG
jgi:hypothetical protein